MKPAHLSIPPRAVKSTIARAYSRRGFLAGTLGSARLTPRQVLARNVRDNVSAVFGNLNTARLRYARCILIAYEIIETGSVVSPPRVGGVPDARSERNIAVEYFPPRRHRCTQKRALVSRAILKGNTRMGHLIDVHDSELAAGEAPHPPHHHLHESLLLIREGVLEVSIGDKTISPGPGSAAYVASNQEHGWRNVGNAPARYFVLAPGDDKAWQPNALYCFGNDQPGTDRGDPGQNDWPVYGRDPGGVRYSLSPESTPCIDARLARAWTY